MPNNSKTLDPTKAKTPRNISLWKRKVKPTFNVGQTYLYTYHSVMDSTKVLGRMLVTVIDRKVTGKVTTVAVIVVAEGNTRPEIIRGLRVHDSNTDSMLDERIDLFGGGCLSWDRDWVFARNRVTNL